MPGPASAPPGEEPDAARARVYLVDDHPVVRAGLVALLGARPDVDVVGEAATAEAALEAIPRVRPDLVLMDLQLGAGMDGVAAIRRLAEQPDAPRVLVLTTYDNDADILRAIEAGASGYLLKDADPRELVDAIHAAVAGQAALGPRVATRLVARLRGDDSTLTVREIEIVELVADGLGNAEIGRRLFISEATVKSHLVHVFAKLDAANRTAAVANARRRGLIR
jgi:DNA-binding NarL/FixJ family response regulator